MNYEALLILTMKGGEKSRQDNETTSAEHWTLRTQDTGREERVGAEKASEKKRSYLGKS